MSNLCFSIFGLELEWTVSTAVLILMFAQLVIVAVAILALVIILLRKHSFGRAKQTILVANTAEGEREEHALVGIVLDASAVRRKFTVGDAFECSGLTVNARYSDGLMEPITDYLVDPPSLDAAGSPSVTVRFGGFSAMYTIDVVPAAERAVIGIVLDVSAVHTEFHAGEPFECGGLVVRANYNEEPFSEEVYSYSVDEPDMDVPGEKSVAVRFDDFIEFYTINVLPAAERTLVGIDLDLDFVKTDFLVGEEFDYNGLGVIARYEGEAEGERVTDFTVDPPDLSVKGMTNVVVHYREFTQTYPVFVAEGRALVGISLDTSVVRREFTAGEEFNSMGLIVTADYDAEPYSEQLVDYEVEAPDMTAEGEHEVIIRYLDKTASYTVTVVLPQPEDEDVTLLCYDRSFTARLIQSSDDTKRWYGQLKNELLSYRKIKSRMSWKRESYRYGRECVARFGFRGKSLCLFLPLDANDYLESKYKVEDVSENKSVEDTPCMYRIKNDRRAKRAAELIAVCMERIGTERAEHPEEDYYLPYEGIHELVDRGLAKRFFVDGGTFDNLAKQDAETPEAEVAAAEEGKTE